MAPCGAEEETNPEGTSTADFCLLVANLVRLQCSYAQNFNFQRNQERHFWAHSEQAIQYNFYYRKPIRGGVL